MQNNNSLILEINNSFGSVEHYYHFLLGFLCPLVYWYHTNDIEQYEQIYIRSCGILDEHICALNLPKVKILKKENYRLYLNGNVRSEKILGYDYWSYDQINQIIYAKNKIIEILKNKQSIYGGKNINVLAIDREPSNKFYHSSECEIPGSGTDRRSIPNFKSLMNSISEYNPMIVTLENMSLKDQINIFSSSKLIIAQHGASLSNVIFCEPDTVILEILPKDDPQKTYGINESIFNKLSRKFNLNYFVIDQYGSHSEVDPKIFEDKFNSIIRS